jgi:hypothetical protein
MGLCSSSTASAHRAAVAGKKESNGVHGIVACEKRTNFGYDKDSQSCTGHVAACPGELRGRGCGHVGGDRSEKVKTMSMASYVSDLAFTNGESR